MNFKINYKDVIRQLQKINTPLARGESNGGKSSLERGFRGSINFCELPKSLYFSE